MKIWIRFVLYSTLGLLFFCAYFVFVLPSIVHWLAPAASWQTHLEIPGVYDASEAVQLAGVFLLCFVPAAVVFSVFLVMPVFGLISSIRRLEANDLETREIRGGNVAGLLFREVFSTVEKLKIRLEAAEQERHAAEAAKRAWLEGVTHDLKTPLSYVTGYSSLLLAPGYAFEKDELHTHLSTMYSKARQMSELIDDLNLSFLLDSGNPLPVCRERVDPSKLMQRVADSFAADTRWNAYHIDSIVSEGVFFLWLDTKLVARALFNLVQNCVDHTPPGTIVRLACGTTPDGSAFISVQDNGGGMDENMLKRCLDKHYSGNGVCPGKGLGLFIVKCIADAHGAGLTVESSQNRGTSIRLTFPEEA